MAKVERLELADRLSAMPLFRGLPTHAVRKLAKAAERTEVQRRECFYIAGQVADNFFLLFSGRVKISAHTADGGQFVLNLVSPGEAFGALSAGRGRHYAATAEAVQNASATVWTAMTIRQAFEHEPRLALNTLDLVTALDAVQVHFSQFATERVDRRVARVLLRLASGAGRRSDAGVEIAFPISRQEIADMSGTTLFTVSRLLRGWERRGIVLAGRQRVVIVKSSTLAGIPNT